jgi:hypothetical protein
MVAKKRTLRHKRANKRRTKCSTRHSSKHSTRHSTRRSTRKNRRVMKGGNYETDITTRTTEGTPTKPLEKLVVTVPGRGVMDGKAYKQLMEDLDRNGNREYF